MCFLTHGCSGLAPAGFASLTPPARAAEPQRWASHLMLGAPKH